MERPARPWWCRSRALWRMGRREDRWTIREGMGGKPPVAGGIGGSITGRLGWTIGEEMGGGRWTITGRSRVDDWRGDGRGAVHDYGDE